MRSEPPIEQEFDDGAMLRRQLGIAARSLLRPGTYFGATREALLAAVHLAAYPFGLRRDPRHATPYRPLPGDHPGAADLDPEIAGMPVILLHGYIHNRSAFIGMSRALRRAGFNHVHGFDYNPLSYDIPEIAGMLADELDRVLEVTGARRCMLVGHSMGGIIARYYVQQLGGEDTVDTVVTLGAPHRGTYASYLGVGPAIDQIRPGSALLRKLEETARPSDVRWIAYYSDLDVLVVPGSNARLVHPALRATNIRLRTTGHMSLLLSGEVLRGVVAHLVDPTADRPAGLPEVASLPTGPQRARRSRRAPAVLPELPAEA